MSDTVSPLVSIVIPCFRHGQYVKAALDSALEQTYQNIEVILLDDGSDDEVTKQFFATYQAPARVYVLRTDNQGLATARNTAISAAKGEFIVPLDADDELAPAFVERTLAEMLKDDKTAVVYTDQQLYGDVYEIVVMRDFDFVTELVQNHVSVTSLIRRSAYEQVKRVNGHGYNPNMKYGYEDWDLWIGLGEQGWQFKHVAEPLFRYHKHGTSMIATATEKHEYLIRQLVANHPETFAQHASELMVKLQVLLKQQELLNSQLQGDSRSPAWLAKRIIKSVIGNA